MFGVGVGGLLVTFEQPFRLPRAEQAQGVPPRLNPQLKKAQPAISRTAFPTTILTRSTGSVLTEVSISPKVVRLSLEAWNRGFTTAGRKEPYTV